MESTLKNMVLVLLVITLVAATAVGMVYKVTEAPIAQAKAAKTTAALAEVLPQFDNDPAAAKEVVEVDGLPVTIYTAEKAGEKVGYAIETATMQGFSGLIRMMVGFLPDGTIRNIQVLQHGETPGLGSKITEPGNVLLVSFQGNSPANMQMSVRKDGGDVDAITASTITSRAYIDAVARAYNALMQKTGGEGVSGATPGSAAVKTSDAASGSTPEKSSEATGAIVGSTAETDSTAVTLPEQKGGTHE